MILFLDNELITAGIHSFIMALGLIMPLGIQNIFIFNQGASHRTFKGALPSIITAGICDSILILLSIMGVSMLVLKIFWLKEMILIVGFIFLLYMGFATWRNSTEYKQEHNALPAKQQILFAMSVSFLNPHAIIDTVTVMGTNSLHYQGAAKVVFTLGCIIASWTWFFILVIIGSRISKMDSGMQMIGYINKLSAIIIWAVAIYIGTQIIGF